VTDRVTKEVTHVWKDHLELQLEFARFESARALIEMTGRDEDVVVTTLRVQMEDVKGVIQFALPFPVLESFFSPAPVSRIPAAQNRTPVERAAERTQIEGTVRRAHVVVSARLTESRSTLGLLSALRPGDVLPVADASSGSVEVYVAGKLRFKGIQGKLGSHLGVQITEALSRD
jgi:flagellar motor switch protein FliM